MMNGHSPRLPFQSCEVFLASRSLPWPASLRARARQSWLSGTETISASVVFPPCALTCMLAPSSLPVRPCIGCPTLNKFRVCIYLHVLCDTALATKASPSRQRHTAPCFNNAAAAWPIRVSVQSCLQRASNNGIMSVKKRRISCINKEQGEIRALNYPAEKTALVSLSKRAPCSATTPRTTAPQLICSSGKTRAVKAALAREAKLAPFSRFPALGSRT